MRAGRCRFVIELLADFLPDLTKLLRRSFDRLRIDDFLHHGQVLGQPRLLGFAWRLHQPLGLGSLGLLLSSGLHQFYTRKQKLKLRGIELFTAGAKYPA